MNDKLKTEGLLEKGESYFLKQAWEKYQEALEHTKDP